MVETIVGTYGGDGKAVYTMESEATAEILEVVMFVEVRKAVEMVGLVEIERVVQS